MKILFVNAYFWPENIAFSHLERDIMRGLLDAGHEICVVCPTPSRGLRREEIKVFRKRRRDTADGVSIVRYWAPAEGKNPVVRALRYFWCNLRGNMTARRVRDADALFAVSTPPTQGYSVGKLARRRGIPLVYSLQDLFPDSLVSSGLTTRDSLLYRLGASIEKKTYPLCTRIIVLSAAMERSLLEKGVAREKLLRIGNWIDTERVVPVAREDNALFDELGLDRKKYTVVYAGNFGVSQGADIVLKAAALLKDEPEIRFVIFGGGSGFEAAVREAEKNALGNVLIRPLLPVERVSEVYSLGDLALITCKKGVGKTALPSKLYSIMACGTPIVASFDADSELADILREAGCGMTAEPEDADALAQAIRTAYREGMSGASGRAFVDSHASKQHCVPLYVRCFDTLVEKQSDTPTGSFSA